MTSLGLLIKDFYRAEVFHFGTDFPRFFSLNLPAASFTGRKVGKKLLRSRVPTAVVFGRL